MTQLLLALVLMEMALIVVLRFERLLGELLVLAVILLDGRGQLVAGTVAATMVIVFSSAIYKVLCILRHWIYVNNFLEAFLMGFSLLLGILICRLHKSIVWFYMSRILREGLIQ
ncbi:hypothetical protein BT93_F2908 [Corymbia citriodora subsp. variegata]|nr:hypothetical protein BT93_F2908 [Corymbia citriodora subsp. variegata]